MQEISAAKVFSWPSWRIRIAFWTPVPGPREPELDLRLGGLQVDRELVAKIAHRVEP